MKKGERITSNNANWTEAEDAAIKNEVEPLLIVAKERIDWNSIFDEIKGKVPGRTAASAKLRWQNYLNPNWDHGVIEQEESMEIIENFGRHGFNFTLYESRKRSTPSLRAFIGDYVANMHEKKTSECIFSFLYRKLVDVLEKHKVDSIDIETWMIEATEGDTNLVKAYKFVVWRHEILRRSYGIELKNGNVSINSCGIYRKILKNRKRFKIVVLC